MYIFSAFLNDDKLPQHLIPMGSTFHNRGPNTRNDRSPKLAMWNICGANVVQMNVCVMDTVYLTGLPSHAEIGTLRERFCTRFERDDPRCHVLNSLEFVNFTNTHTHTHTHKYIIIYSYMTVNHCTR